MKTPENSRRAQIVARPRAIGVLVDARPRVVIGIAATIKNTADKRYKPLFEAFILYSWLPCCDCGDSIVPLCVDCHIERSTLQ